MVSIFSDDDNFDIDQGYRGKNQFWFALQAPDQQGQRRRMERRAQRHRRGQCAHRQLHDLQRHLYRGGHQLVRCPGLHLAGVCGAEACSTASSRSSTLAATLTTSRPSTSPTDWPRFQNNIFWNFASNGVAQPYWQNANAQWVLTDAANNNSFVDPMLTSISRTNDPAFQLDPRPQPGSPALTSSRHRSQRRLLYSCGLHGRI